MGRHSCCYKEKLRKGLWSPEEDEKLVRHITEYGHGCWSAVPKLAGLQRCGKSCRLRWINYLRPDLKRGAFSPQEEDLIIKLHSAVGNRWSQIASRLPGRTDNEIKNLWNSTIKKRLIHKGIDPNTHKPLLKVKKGREGETKPEAGNFGDRTSGGFSSVHNLEVDTHKSGERKPISPNAEPYSLTGPLSLKTHHPDSSKSINPAPARKLLAEKFAGLSEKSPVEPIRIFPFQQLNYDGSGAECSFDSYLNHNLMVSDAKSAFHSSSSPAVLPKPHSFSSLTAQPQERLKPHFSLSSNGKIRNSELQSNVFSWDLRAEKELEEEQTHQPNFNGNESEDLKWSDYLNMPFLIANPVQGQDKPTPPNGVVSEARFISELSCVGGTNQQGELPSQGSDIYRKGIRRLAAAFGNY
ncbi:uncharacterized protein J3R85_011095 [Psidium guajava]|nr:uncharacterized protein J3R85_011095 [Psidium guajava]